ncbi:hypothetical protein pb186bvf_019863 [Paramecium bursaria]
MEISIYKSHLFHPYIQKSNFKHIFFNNRNIFIQQLLFILNKRSLNKNLAVMLIQFSAHLFIKMQGINDYFINNYCTYIKKGNQEVIFHSSRMITNYPSIPTKAPIVDADSTLIQQQKKYISQFSSQLDKEGELNILSENEAFIVLFQLQQCARIQFSHFLLNIRMFIIKFSYETQIVLSEQYFTDYCDICAQKSLREQINCYTVKINYKSHKIKMFTYVPRLNSINEINQSFYYNQSLLQNKSFLLQDFRLLQPH